MFADLVQILKAAEKTACMTFWLVLIVFMNQNMWLARWRTTVTSTRNRCIHTTHVASWWDFWFIDLLGCWSQQFKILWPLSKVKQDYSKDIHCGYKQQKEPIVISIFGTLTSRTMQPEKKIMISNINHDISYYIYNSLRSAERNTIPVEYTQ